MINKTDLAAKLAETLDISKTKAADAMSALVALMTDTLVKGEQVRITDFGTFKIRERAARTGRNPQTGDTVDIPACKAVGFKASKKLKEAVNL